MYRQNFFFFFFWKQKSNWKSDLYFFLLWMLFLFTANWNCYWRWFADQRTSLLWLINVWDSVVTYKVFLGWWDLAWHTTIEWCHEYRWMHRVPSTVECNTVCLLYSRWRKRIYCWVSTMLFFFPSLLCFSFLYPCGNLGQNLCGGKWKIQVEYLLSKILVTRSILVFRFFLIFGILAI